ncbi:hypothetical protein R1flu_024758 [Riccia fluitans]|uniref:Reverse transcriptase n=1 Tax=Riccia fluitans TaxID=41844 RepID=A0ABD1XYU1_9MARC
MAFLDDLPTPKEFTDVLLASPRGKSPGIDGFNSEAFLELWPFIGKTYVDAMQDCWKRKEFPEGFMEGIMTLIPKVHNVESLRDWRPITLLSTVYKLYAKLIAM